METTSAHAARVLDLFGQVTFESVQCARRELAMKYHPDRFSDAEGATRHMARINAATDTLIAHLKIQAAANSGRTLASCPEVRATVRKIVIEAASHAQNRAPRTTKSPKRSIASSRADNPLNSLAATSYGGFLGRSTGTVNTGSSVDIRA